METTHIFHSIIGNTSFRLSRKNGRKRDRDHIHERHSRTDSAIPETDNIRESSESETSERDSGGRGR